MQNATRLVFNTLMQRLSEINGVPSAREQFAVAPTVQQTLETKIQESSEFLGKINIIGVDEMQGEKLGLGVSGPIASRTNTDNNDRAPRSVETLDATGYQCKKTNYDTAIKYATLDAWAKFPDFQTRVRDVIVKRHLGWWRQSGAAVHSRGVDAAHVAHGLRMQMQVLIRSC